jgi:hypothetical protein
MFFAAAVHFAIEGAFCAKYIKPYSWPIVRFVLAYQCSSIGAGAMRNETVPFIFGITLAAVAILTVGGYAVFRHFKIKKVQYDTME